MNEPDDLHIHIFKVTADDGKRGWEWFVESEPGAILAHSHWPVTFRANLAHTIGVQVARLINGQEPEGGYRP